MINEIKHKLNFRIKEKRILILGYGKEGRSSYYWLRTFFPTLELTIADKNTEIANESNLASDNYLTFLLGHDYLTAINFTDFILKSPGISLKNEKNIRAEISSQTDLFLYCLGKQTIGVTGTKGKSTTSSLLFHLIKSQHANTLLVGNIGIPAFDAFKVVNKNTLIVFEMSSHQLEYIHSSPHIAIFLNLYQEHLDHYNSYLDYQKSKFNIAIYQSKNDFFIFNQSDELIINLLKSNPETKGQREGFSQNSGEAHIVEDGFYIRQKQFYVDLNALNIKGKHNFLNAAVALLACHNLGFSVENLIPNLATFKPLEHRMEFVGTFKSIDFYNDSISTIPEACIQAIESIKNVETLILGGFDRGINYDGLIHYLQTKSIKNIILVGNVGERIKNGLLTTSYKSSIFEAKTMDEIVSIAFNETPKGKVCLLSPAASSYDQYKNFEERGSLFKQKVRQLALLNEFQK